MWETEAMLRPTSLNRSDIVADVALRIAADAGLAGLTASGIARAMGVTPQALLNRYGSADRVLRIAIATSAARWAAWMGSRVRLSTHGQSGTTTGRRSSGEALAPILPTTAGDIEQCRWWLTLRCFAEHGRGRDSGMAQLIAPADEADRYLIRSWLGERLIDPVRVEALLACVNGLRARLTNGEDPLTPGDARHVLVLVAEQVRAATREPPRGGGDDLPVAGQPQV